LLIAAMSLGAFSFVACSSGDNGSAPVTDGGAVVDGSALVDGDAPTDGGVDASADAALSALTSCPTSIIQTPGACYEVLPTDTGADPSGENAAYPSIALTPDPKATPLHQLVLFLNGTSGHPRDDIASQTVSFYDTAASLGYSVLAVSYRSIETMANLCTPSGSMIPTDSCYFPTRETLIRGVLQPGASSGVANVRLDEGIADRTLLALQYLAARDPADGWDEYFTAGAAGATPESRIVWSKIVSAGHSQGGGHAAAIGKLFPVARVVQFSATCDAIGETTPATWTTGSIAPWASDPSMFWGLGVQTTFGADGGATGGDTQCFTHLVVWNNLGMTTSHQNDTGVTCTKASKTVDAHDATIGCPQNADAWKAMLQ
jgi:hypothetical protein